MDQSDRRRKRETALVEQEDEEEDEEEYEDDGNDEEEAAERIRSGRKARESSEADKDVDSWTKMSGDRGKNHR